MPETDLLKTPLYDLHLELGARMVPFAGYAMPVQYPSGLIAEHKHTREAASLFDVSHMGQIQLIGPDAALALESLIPADALSLAENHQRYGMFLTTEGTIMDDFMFVNRGDHIFAVVNGACKAADIAHLQAHIGQRCKVQPLPEQALLALQGPKARQVLSRLLPGSQQLVFMQGAALEWQGVPIYITCSGYTGEDGFEISIPGEHAEAFARQLLAQEEVQAAGLGARNSLRLEAGLCLYGNDIDTTTTPIEAGLNWAIQKSRRTGGERAGGFPGADIILAQLERQVPLQRKRVNLLGSERIPVREPAELVNMDGQKIGQITSGLLSPILNLPIAMGYVEPDYAAVNTEVFAKVRRKSVPMRVQAGAFIAPNYHRG